VKWWLRRMMIMMYRSSFGDIATDDHYGADALCLSRTHCVDAVEDTLAEFYRAAVAVIDSEAAQPAFFLARQLAELGLKALYAPNFPAGHSLTRLLDGLAQRGDELLAGGDEQDLVVAFVRDLDKYDPAWTKVVIRPPVRVILLWRPCAVPTRPCCVNTSIGCTGTSSAGWPAAPRPPRRLDRPQRRR
jgi:hypothetical protein